MGKGWGEKGDVKEAEEPPDGSAPHSDGGPADLALPTPRGHEIDAFSKTKQ